jgi:hypothetical protein
MKKRYFAVLFTLIYVLALGVSARAQGEDTVVAIVPYAFVAGGAVLPAGTYRVSRIETGAERGLRISSYEIDASAFLLPTTFAGVHAEQPQLSFETIADKHFLSKIQTANGVYTIGIPRSATELAQKEQRERMSSSGDN